MPAFLCMVTIHLPVFLLLSFLEQTGMRQFVGRYLFTQQLILFLHTQLPPVFQVAGIADAAK